MRSTERVNREVWSSRKVRDIFAARDGFIDAGERILLERVLAESERRPVLDIGIGAGRTIPLIAPRSDDYVAVDYLPEMVALARSLHPGTRVEQADARTLSKFPDDTFGAVFFSFNGIDGIAHEDRDAVHRAALRVLAPGGAYLFSTHNLDHPAAGMPPWHPLHRDIHNGLRAALSYAWRMPQRAMSYQRLAPLTHHGDGWAVLVGSGYDFTVLWHHISAAEGTAEILRAGFAEPVEVFDTAGAAVGPATHTASSPWLYVLAHKPRAGS